MRLPDCLQLLLAASCIVAGSQTNFQTDKLKKDLHVLTLAPYIIPEFTLELQLNFDFGNAIYPAIELAAEMINNRTDVLDGYNIKLLRGNSACSIPFRATEGLLRGLSLGKDDPPVVGIIGPDCSISSISVAEFCGREQISLLNLYVAGTPRISDRKKYPFAYGSLDSVNVIAKAVVALIKQQSWKSIGVFYAESRDYYSSLAQVLHKEIVKYNTTVEEDETVIVNLRGVRTNKPAPVASIQNRNRITVIMADGQLLMQMLCLLYHLGIEFPNYMFILAGAVAIQPDDVELTYNSRNLICFSSTLETILSTSILIDYQLETFDRTDIKFSGISLETFRMLYEEKIQRFNEENNAQVFPLLEGAMIFDSMWSLSLALNNSMDRVNLSTYYFLGQQENTKIIRDELDQLDYEGVSGRIRYDSATGRVRQNITITLVDGAKMGYYTAVSNNVTIIAPQLFNTSFIDNHFAYKTLLIPEFLFYIVVIFAVISLVVVVSLHITTFIYRNRQSVKATSVKMSQVAYASCYAFIVSSLLNVVIQGGFLGAIEPSATCILQHVLDVVFSLSLTLLFGTTCLRTWRLYRIFIHFKSPGKFLSDNYLLAAMGVLVLFDLAFSVPPIFIYRYKASFLDVTPADNTEPVLSQIMICKRDLNYLWVIFDLGVTTFLMIILIFLTFKTRNIAQKNFKTKLTVWMLYIMSLVLPIALGLYVPFTIRFSYTSKIIQFVIFSILMELLIITTVVLVFIPPLLPVFLGTKRLSRWQAATSSRRKSSLLSRNSLFSINF